MRLVLSWLLWGGLLLLSGWPQLGYAQATFEAFADAKEVVRNSYFEVTFTLKNAQGDNFRPPSFNDFRVLSGPNRGFRTSVINGQVSQETSYTYQLQPKRTGTLRIGEAQINAGGSTLRSRPLTIRVVAGQASADGSAEVLLEARISSQEAYLGQQLILDYVLSSRVEYRGLTAAGESDYRGFFSRAVQQFDSRVQREVIDGVQYRSRIIKRVVLYPQETGTLAIDPLTVALGIVIPGRTGGGFFSSVPTRKVTLSTKPIEVAVRPLPQPQPANFSGITGSYSMRTQLTKKKLTTDDALSVFLILEGSGDLKRVQAPTLDFPPAFEVYDPKLKEEEYYDLPTQVKGRKVFEYVLVPQEAGDFTIQPEVVVFNPDSAAYLTLRHSTLRLNVTPGSGEKSSGLVADGQERQDLYGPRADIDLGNANSRFFRAPFFWGLYALPFLVGFGFWFRDWRARQQPSIDPTMLRQQQARTQALKRLAAARAHQHKANGKAFYDEMEAALLGYLGDKVQMPRADLSKSNITNKLVGLGLADELTQEFVQLLQRCEMALYAGMDNTAAMEETYERALVLLEGMEEGLSTTTS